MRTFSHMRSAALALVTLAFFAASSALALDVAIYQGPGVGGKGPKNMEKLLTEREHRVEFVSPDDVRAGKLKEFDVVIFPGGSGSKEAAGLGDDGREEVRKFIRTGGGYVGVCAGAYLGTCRYDWGLKVIDAQTVDSAHWKRGEGMVEIELTEAGRKVLGDRQGKFEIQYANGPLLGPYRDEKLPDYEVLAYFRTELAKNGAPEGVMVDTPAIISSPLDEGRVVLISPHAEGMPELEWIIENAVRWSAHQSAAPVEEPALAR